MSASTVSITANPAARRRPVVAGDKKSNSIEFLNNEVHLNGAGGGDNNAVGLDRIVGTATASHSKDVSHHSIRGEAVLEKTSRDLIQLKKSGMGNSTVSPRRSRKVGAKTEKPLWKTVVSIFAKNFVLLIVLVGLVQIVRRLALKSGDFSSGTLVGLTEFEGRIAEFESSVKKTANMIQLQVEVLDKKIENKVEGLRTEMSKKIDDKGEFFESELKNLVGRTDGLKKSVEELTAVDWLTKEEFEKFYEEFRKQKANKAGGDDVNLDDIRVYARDIVQKEIEKHAADGLGRADYALASSGAVVVKHSEPFAVGKTKWFFNPFPSSSVGFPGTHPLANKMLKPSFGEPGQCFPLKGSSGFVVIKLRAAIVPEAITLEHVAKSVAYDRKTAPKDCRVSGWLQGQDLDAAVDPQKMLLLAEFSYDLEKSSAQTFDVLELESSRLVDMVRLDFASNHGNPSFTCIYRLRVHGYEPDAVSMIATENV